MTSTAPSKRPSEAAIQREIDLAMTREGLCICRAVAVERAKAAARKREPK